MARVTVEDCLKNVKNRFELVILSAKRARQLMHGQQARVEWDNDKPTVVALREIAEGHTNFDTPAHQEAEPIMSLNLHAEPQRHTETPSSEEQSSIAQAPTSKSGEE